MRSALEFDALLNCVLVKPAAFENFCCKLEACFNGFWNSCGGTCPCQSPGLLLVARSHEERNMRRSFSHSDGEQFSVLGIAESDHEGAGLTYMSGLQNL